MDDSVKVPTTEHARTTAAKPKLLVDVGGTNTRVALVREEDFHELRRFDNADFASLYDLLKSYLSRVRIDKVGECSVAMAGPVRAGGGALTNRDWHISTRELVQTLGCDNAVVLNDLTALGFAVGTLADDSLAEIDAPASQTKNGQALVVGIGTGFNLSPVKRADDGSIHCLEVEMGHASLPVPVRDTLQNHLSQKDIAEFSTLEQLFSGSGLARFHLRRSGQSLSGKEIAQRRDQGDVVATETLTIYASLLGLLCREFAFQYMPMDGIYFAGSVARGVLQRDVYYHIRGVDDDVGKVGDLLSRIPKWIVLDDAAALQGCLVALK